MLSIEVSYRRCGRNLRAKLDTVINSLSANEACLKTLYLLQIRFDYESTAVQFPFNSTTLRPLEDLRSDRRHTTVCGLLALRSHVGVMR